MHSRSDERRSLSVARSTSGGPAAGFNPRTCPMAQDGETVFDYVDDALLGLLFAYCSTAEDEEAAVANLERRGGMRSVEPLRTAYRRWAQLRQQAAEPVAVEKAKAALRAFLLTAVPSPTTPPVPSTTAAAAPSLAAPRLLRSDPHWRLRQLLDSPLCLRGWRAVRQAPRIELLKATQPGRHNLRRRQAGGACSSDPAPDDFPPPRDESDEALEEDGSAFVPRAVKRAAYCELLLEAAREANADAAVRTPQPLLRAGLGRGSSGGGCAWATGGDKKAQYAAVRAAAWWGETSAAVSAAQAAFAEATAALLAERTAARREKSFEHMLAAAADAA